MDSLENARSKVQVVDQAGKVPTVDIEELSTKAVYHTVAINLTDKLTDPIHYSLGMWGKLILLGTIKHQGITQQVDPEKKIHELNWDNISREVFHRAIPRMQYMLSASTCLHWYENRLRLYKERFPYYHCHGAMMIDQLIRHYSIQLTTLMEAAGRFGLNWNRLYWENLHALPSSGATYQPTQSAPSISYEDIFQNLKLYSSTFCSVVGMRNKTCNDSSEMLKVDQINGSKVEIVERKQGNSYSLTNSSNLVNVPRSNKPAHSMAIKSSYGSVSLPGTYHAVIEHNVVAERCPPLMRAGAGMKRVQSAGGGGSTQEPNESFKRPRVQGSEQTLLMLSVLWKLKEGQGLLPEMFRTVAKRMGDNPCEFTLTRMEEKVHNGEITDVKDLMKSCRCLVLLYLVLQNGRKVPQVVRELLVSLRDTCV